SAGHATPTDPAARRSPGPARPDDHQAATRAYPAATETPGPEARVGMSEPRRPSSSKVEIDSRDAPILQQALRHRDQNRAVVNERESLRRGFRSAGVSLRDHALAVGDRLRVWRGDRVWSGWLVTSCGSWSSR